MTKRRVGFFGGTFNPIHLGHLRIAEEVADYAHLDEVMFVPNGIPPHRGNPGVLAQQRLTMVRLAVADNPRFTVNPVEVLDTVHRCNYTVDTLTALTQRHPDMSFSLICGSDIQHQKWYRFDDIMRMLEALYVVYRPGDDAQSMASCMFERVGGNEELFAKYHWVQTDGISISSTLVRDLIAQGKSVRYLVPDAVAEYIEQRHIYAEESHR